MGTLMQEPADGAEWARGSWSPVGVLSGRLSVCDLKAPSLLHHSLLPQGSPQRLGRRVPSIGPSRERG